MTRPTDPFPVAVVQAAAVMFDREASLAKALRLIAAASEKGARLVVLPEAFISGYPRGSTFGATIGDRSAAGRDEYLRYWDSAVDVPGPVVSSLAEAAAEHEVFVVVGVIERAGGTLYCTVLFFAPDGALLGKHRKLVPTGSERLVWGSGDGSTLPVFDTSVGRIGAVICWENYMPLLRAAMYAKGVEIYCAPTADARDTWLASMRHIACEGRCYVLSANQFTRRADAPTGASPSGEDDADAVTCRGGSAIISPFGDVIAGPCYDGEDILVAEVNLAEIIRGKYDFDAVGHYARNDIFTLTVDERVRSGLEFTHSARGADGG